MYAEDAGCPAQLSRNAPRQLPVPEIRGYRRRFQRICIKRHTFSNRFQIAAFGTITIAEHYKPMLLIIVAIAPGGCIVGNNR
jgi:hypothetical protein